MRSLSDLRSSRMLPYKDSSARGVSVKILEQLAPGKDKILTMAAAARKEKSKQLAMQRAMATKRRRTMTIAESLGEELPEEDAEP